MFKHACVESILQDPGTGNWWLSFLSGGVDVGYWPKELFTSLDTSTEIDFGGAVYTPNNEGSPPMGNGHFPDEGIGKCSYFMQVQFIGTDGRAFTPTEGSAYPADNISSRYYYTFGEPPKNGGDFDMSYGGPGGYFAG